LQTSYDTGEVGWNGPVWLSVNYLIIGALNRLGQHYGDEITFEIPVGSGTQRHLTDAAHDLAGRLIAPFLRGPDGRRPILGAQRMLQQDPNWNDLLPFHECVDPETGAGLGSSHGTGAAGLVAHLIASRSGVSTDANL
jgi:hypothetical protein